MGGGSAQLNPHYRVSPWEGLAAALGEERLGYRRRLHQPPLRAAAAPATFAPSSSLAATSPARSSTARRWTEAQASGSAPVGGGKVDPARYSARLTGRFMPEASGEHRVGVFAAGLARVLRRRPAGRRRLDAAGPGPHLLRGGLRRGRRHRRPRRRPAATRSSSSSPPSRPQTLRFAAFRVGIGMPLGDAAIAAAVRPRRAADVALVFVGRNGEWDTEGSDLDRHRAARPPGRAGRRRRRRQPAHRRGAADRRAGRDALARRVAGRAPGLVSGAGGRQRHRRRAPRRGRAGRPAAADLPARLGGQPDRQPRSRIYPGRDGKVRYDEGMFVGYRHYDARASRRCSRSASASATPASRSQRLRAPSHSGRRHSASAPTVDATPASAPARRSCRSTSRDPESRVPRPQKELKAFAKLALAPGERAPRPPAHARPRDLAFFDAGRRRLAGRGRQLRDPRRLLRHRHPRHRRRDRSTPAARSRPDPAPT